MANLRDSPLYSQEHQTAMARIAIWKGFWYYYIDKQSFEHDGISVGACRNEHLFGKIHICAGAHRHSTWCKRVCAGQYPN